MKKKQLTIFMTIFSILFFVFMGSAAIKSESLNKICISKEEIPEGFVWGKIPPFAKKVLKNNPWNLDKPAIKKLAGRIYPGGDHQSITAIHLTIIAKKNNPYGDDIVCYLLLFRKGKTASTEIEKISEFTGYNRDRAILLTKNNLAVFLHVDDCDNFHYIQDLADSYKAKLNSF